MSKHSKGKPITTSVPSFAIRFHANGEEIEELYPSEEEEKSLTEEKIELPELPKQESSPIRDYLKFSKRSASIDSDINESHNNSDPWRLFSEFKGKLTKTVEEKLSEIKSKNTDNESSPKIVKHENSVSDSEDPSEYSQPKSTLSEEMSSEDESIAENDKTPTIHQKPLISTPELRNRKKPTMQISYKKDQEEILLKTISMDVDDDEDDIKPLEEEIESGIEACEELHIDLVTNLSNVTLYGPKGFIDQRTSAKPPLTQATPYLTFLLLFPLFCLLVLFFFFPIFTLGIMTGIGFTIIGGTFFINHITKQFDVEQVKSDTGIVEIQPAKEFQPVIKFEGWVNEYPEIYDPYTYHISQTQSVYLKLEGNILRISHTNSKIPKRAMWNENRHNVSFTYHRVYNMRGAEVKLLPAGLIHKRIWSKKYPICVILNKEFMHSDLPNKKIEKEETLVEETKKEVKVRRDSERSETGSAVIKDDDEADEFKEVFEDDERSITEDWDTLNIDENSLETKLYLFGRTGRDKEDWFRRLVAATHLPNETKHTENKEEQAKEESDNSQSSESADQKSTGENNTGENVSEPKIDFKDLDEEYMEYMGRLGQIRRESHYPILHQNTKRGKSFFRRKKTKLVAENGTEDIVDIIEQRDDKIDDMEEHLWFNILIGRILFDMNKNQTVIANIQEKIQRKLSTIKLPYFIEEIVISHLDLGNVSPRFHRIWPATLDERGLWVDMEVTYEGLVTMSLVTKLNLMKLKEQAGKVEDQVRPASPMEESKSPMFHSDIEDSAESSTDDEISVAQPNVDSLQESPQSRDAKSKKFLRMIDNIAASSLFQQATENKYIKRALEGVSKTELKLTVEIRTLEGTLAINLSAPPSDRIWLGFRGNPKLHLSAKPAFGERSINFAHVTRWIEKKLALEFQKFMVMPNMEDFVCPLMNPDLPK